MDVIMKYAAIAALMFISTTHVTHATVCSTAGGSATVYKFGSFEDLGDKWISKFVQTKYSVKDLLAMLEIYLSQTFPSGTYIEVCPGLPGTVKLRTPDGTVIYDFSSEVTVNLDASEGFFSGKGDDTGKEKSKGVMPVSVQVNVPSYTVDLQGDGLIFETFRSSGDKNGDGLEKINAGMKGDWSARGTFEGIPVLLKGKVTFKARGEFETGL